MSYTEGFEYPVELIISEADTLSLHIKYAKISARGVIPNNVLNLNSKFFSDSNGISAAFLSDIKCPVESDAAKDLVKRALATPEGEPLYLVAIGAITNVASAILIEPEIINKIVVVWLGGHEPNLDIWGKDPQEFNLSQDILASKLIFDCGVPFIQIPCMYAASPLLTTLAELEAHLSAKNDICDYLVEEFRKYHVEHYAWAKEIWDISTIGYLINPDWVPSFIIHGPILSEDSTMSIDRRRHFIKVAAYVNRNEVFKDMFQKLSGL